MKHERVVLELIDQGIQAKYVAVINVIDNQPFDWACYSGHTSYSTDDIKQFGNKVEISNALNLFPHLVDIYYRV